MPLLETKGAASAQGFGLTLGTAERVFIEDVFSTFLYTGNGSTQTITNGIDLAGKGGLVWCKPRSVSGSHSLTYRPAGWSGAGSWLKTDSSDGSPGNINRSYSATGFSTSGTSVDSNNGDTFASWTLRNQPKFFTAVEYTGNGSNRTIAHDLGSVPGCIIVKRLDFTPASDWQVYHRSLANTEYLVLNSTAAVATGATRWNSTTPTSTVFSLGTDTTVNANGGTYVAYLFAHNAGGFGLSGTDNVVSCGSFVTGSTGVETITLGYEPQLVLFKRSDSTSNWTLLDTMRGFNVGGVDAYLQPNTSAAETTSGYGFPTATGFVINAGFSSGQTYIYIAIRRGPMRVPTSGTSVFSPITYAGNNTASRVISGLINAPDWVLYTARNTGLGQNNHITGSRLQGGGRYLLTESTGSETSSTAYGVQTYGQTSVTLGTATTVEQNASGVNYILYGLGRAPGFFDVVCYTGVGAGTSFTHNLGVVPELIIVKLRSSPVSNTAGWFTYHTALGTSSNLLVNTNAASASTTAWNVISSTTVSFNGAVGPVSVNNDTYVAYLFATCPGVSKVGSYTGTGSTLQINCGFTGGARFVLIKRTDSTGDWYVWDSARGIVASTDPYLVLNSTAAEVTSTDWVDTYSAGFELSSAAGNNVNINAASYIFLSIA